MSTLQRLLANAAALLTSDAMTRATTFVLYALVARRLGADDFGRFSLALTLFYLAQVVAAAGLKSLVMREVAKSRTEAARYLVNGSIIVIATTATAMAGLFLFVHTMDYSRGTAAAILLLSLGLLPFALSAVCEGVLQGLERMPLIAAANVAANLAKIALALVLLGRGYGLMALLGILVGCYVAVCVMEWLLFIKRVGQPLVGKPDLAFCVSLVKRTSSFVGIDGVIALGSSLSVLILSAVTTEREVGLFSSVNQMMVPITVIFSSIMLSISPTLYRRFVVDQAQVRLIAERSIEILAAIAVPSAILLFVLADRLLLLLYGNKEFTEAARVMRLMSWNLIPLAITWVLGQVLIASLREKTVFRIVIIDTAAGLVLGIALTSRFGLIGAGIAAVATRLIDVLQHYRCVTRLHPTLRLGPLTWKPVIAGATMGTVLLLLGDDPLLFIIPCAGIVYLATLLTLGVWTSGGAHQFKGRYLDAWSE